MKNDLPSDALYTLEDLEKWPREGTSLAVLGHPVKHSLSPPMHNAALAELNRDHPEFSDWTYYKFDIQPEELKSALGKFYRKGFKGLNLTVPHKILAAQWVNIGEAEVELTEACNTLLWTENGYQGYNTDLYGLTSAIEDEFKIQLQDRDVLLLGAGGAARAAAVACGQTGVRSLTLANRTVSKLDAIRGVLEKLESCPPVDTCALDQPLPSVSERMIVINATSLGLDPDDPTPADLRKLPASTLVFDMIYNPARTKLLKEAESLGMQVANGLGMLAYQGERSLKIWTQKNPSAKTMFAAAQAGLQST